MIFPPSVDDERVEVVRVLEFDHDHDHDRQRRHDPAGHPSLHGQCLDQPPEVEALANGLRDSVDDLSCVTARIPLQLGDERELLDVTARHALGDHAE